MLMFISVFMLLIIEGLVTWLKSKTNAAHYPDRILGLTMI